jgi:hypothetical protein
MYNMNLIIVQSLTISIALVAAFIFYRLFRRYREIPSTPALFLMLYFLFFSLDYFATFLLRFPNETDSIALTYPIIAFLTFIIARSKSFFSAMFGIFTLSPKHWKKLAIAPAVMVLLIVVLLISFPPFFGEAAYGLGEWVIGGGARIVVYISIAMALIAPLCFLAYSFVVKDRKSRTKGLTIGITFLFLAFLVDFQEPLGAMLPLPVRRALVLVSIIVLYEGFNL